MKAQNSKINDVLDPEEIDNVKDIQDIQELQELRDAKKAAQEAAQAVAAKQQVEPAPKVARAPRAQARPLPAQSEDAPRAQQQFEEQPVQQMNLSELHADLEQPPLLPVQNFPENYKEEQPPRQPSMQSSRETQPSQQPAQARPRMSSQSAQLSPRERSEMQASQRPDRNDNGRHSGRDQQRDQRMRNDDNQRQQPSRQQIESKPATLETMSLVELNLYSRKLGIVGASLMSKADLIERIRFVQAHPDIEMEVEGVLEKLPDGFGFLRSSQYDYVSGPDDVYVSPSQIRRFNLKTGDTVTGEIRKPKEGEKYFALLKVNKVNYEDPSLAGDRVSFDRLTPLHPDRKFNLEATQAGIATRIMDIFTPIGKGQRGLIVAPPKVGKTMLLKEIAQSLIANHPEAHLIVLLIDERPEEVSEMKRTVRGTAAEVVSSTFDEAAERHVQVAETVIEKAKRMVEAGRDVIILLDSITRLARAYNTTAPASGKVLTGGIDANALHRPKRFFGAARSMQEGGSLTIIATALVDTGSRMDEVIYEEFKGTGNMEIHMTRKLANRRTYPAFDLLVSGTRRDDLLQTEEELKKVWVLQKFLSTMNTTEGMELLIDKMKKSKNNEEFFELMNKKPGA